MHPSKLRQFPVFPPLIRHRRKTCHKKPTQAVSLHPPRRSVVCLCYVCVETRSILSKSWQDIYLLSPLIHPSPPQTESPQFIASLLTTCLVSTCLVVFLPSVYRGTRPCCRGSIRDLWVLPGVSLSPAVCRLGLRCWRCSLLAACSSWSLLNSIK